MVTRRLQIKKEKLLKTSDEEVKKKVNAFEKSNKLKHDEMVKVFELKIKERKRTVLNREKKLAEEDKKLGERK